MSQDYISYELQDEKKTVGEVLKQAQAEMECKRFMPRGKILDTAKEIINGERQDQYGQPENNFDLIGQYWRVFLKGRGYGDLVFSPEDVAMMLALLKIARITAGSAKEDSFVDLCGYAALAYDLSKPKVG